MICNCNDYDPSPISEPAQLCSLLEDLPESARNAYGGFLETQPKIKQALIKFFSSPDAYPHITPLIIYNEVDHSIVTIMANNQAKPDEIGEEGSILAYVRTYGFDETFMCSDCYGQLSCSSCAVELLYGSVGNPEPREEEYDMLDIDDAKPATEKSRLSCQLIVGDTPLVLKIRAPQKILSKVL